MFYLPSLNTLYNGMLTASLANTIANTLVSNMLNSSKTAVKWNIFSPLILPQDLNVPAFLCNDLIQLLQGIRILDKRLKHLIEKNGIIL